MSYLGKLDLRTARPVGPLSLGQTVGNLIASGEQQQPLNIDTQAAQNPQTVIGANVAPIQTISADQITNDVPMITLDSEADTYPDPLAAGFAGGGPAFDQDDSGAAPTGTATDASYTGPALHMNPTHQVQLLATQALSSQGFNPNAEPVTRTPYVDALYFLAAGYAAPDYDPDPTPDLLGSVPSAPTTTSNTPSVTDQERSAFQDLVTEAEGIKRNSDGLAYVYNDTTGNPTVGIGHKVVPADNLNLGDTISDAQVAQFFQQDSSTAFNAALSQAAEAGITDPHFIPYLASVNYQLGTSWNVEFDTTWNLIVNGQYQQAANGLSSSAWNTQTPKRVAAFQNALRALPPKPGT